MPPTPVPRGPRPDRRFVAEPLERRLLLDASVSLVRDVNAHDLGSYPGAGFPTGARSGYAEMNDVLYFAADDTDRGIELWRTDGSDAGTWLVRDIDTRPPYRQFNPNSDPFREGHGVPVRLRAVGSTLFFFARDAEHGSELWKSDGTAEGTVLVKDITPGPASSVIEDEYSSAQGFYSTDAGGLLYFTMPDLPSRQTLGLWRSDGTEQGTFRLSNFRASSQPLAAAGGTVFFASGDATTGTELWKTDGTVAGTTLVREIVTGPQSSHVSGLTAVGDVLYFQAALATDGAGNPSHWYLHRSDGTPGGTPSVAHLGDATGTLTAIGDTLYSVRQESGNAVSLWKSDGTTAGTSVFKVMATARDLTAGPGGAVYFAGSDVPNEWELWKTDGTPTGTVRVKEIGPGLGSSIHTMAFVGGVLYISGDDSVGTWDTTNAELWRSDGTEAGTVKVKEISPGPVGSYPFAFHLINGHVVFSTRFGTRPAAELWTTDGTAAGTVMLKNLNLNTESAIDNDETPMAFGGQFFFVASAGDDRGPALWKSDGSAAGTLLVKDISDAVPGTTDDNFRRIGNLTDLGGTLLFFAGDLATGRELWRSDGTPEGTVLLKDINPGAATGVRLGSHAASLGNTLYFTADDGVHGRELWKTDGTAEGTVMLADATPGPAGSYFLGLSPVGNRLFIPLFISADNTVDLWTSDGTAAGTALVRRIGRPRSLSLDRFPIFDFQGKAYFSHDNLTTGEELWTSDGTAAGTGLLKDIVPGDLDSHSGPANFTRFGPHFYFATVYGAERLWRSDGTAAGTVPANVGVSGLVPRFAHDGRLYLTGRLNGAQKGLWVSDGTPAGTTLLVPQMYADTFSVFAGKVYVGGYVLDAASFNTLPGTELWETDGTAAGTRPVAEIYPGRHFSSPTPLAVSGDVAVFVATDRRHGRELWRLDVQSPAAVVGRHLFYGGSARDAALPGAAGAPDLATDKAPLLPGGAASFRNVSSYARGINGLILDVRGLPQGAGPSAADFDFHVGTAAAWRPAPAPAAVAVERGAGTGGSDRITLTWPDGAIRNTWLRVSAKPTPATGLAALDVFYFGNLPGETGDAGTLSVTARDLALTRMRLGSPNPAHRTRHDFDRNGVIDARDVMIVRNNQRRTLPLFTPAAAPPPAPAPPNPRTAPPGRGSFFSPPDETPSLLA